MHCHACKPRATGRRRQHCSNIAVLGDSASSTTCSRAGSSHYVPPPSPITTYPPTHPHRHTACPVREGMASSSCRAFVSGPIDSSDEYFALHYIPRIGAAMRLGDHFVVGPVPGVDTQTLSYLLSPPPPVRPCEPHRISVYMAAFEFADLTRRNHYRDLGVNVIEVATAGQGTTTRQRDEMMTRESDYDILRYRSEEEAKRFYGESWWPRVSNTEVNERRRRGITDLSYNLEGSVAPLADKGKGEREVGEDSSRGKAVGLGRRLQNYLEKRKA